MSICTGAGRPGCRGMLCRSAHAVLRRLPVLRYPSDEHGQPDTSARPMQGWVCALAAFGSSSRSGSLNIPGTTGGQLPARLTVAAGSLEPPLKAFDRVTISGQTWQVGSVITGSALTAELLPAGEV